MENWMFMVGFISQWAKANPKVPNILVVLGVCVVGYVGYWLTSDATLPTTVETFKAFIVAGSDWALKGVFALQTTSAAASGISGLRLPEGVANAIPATKN